MPKPVQRMRTLCTVLIVLIGLVLLTLPVAFLVEYLTGETDEFLDSSFGRKILVAFATIATATMILLVSVLRAGKSRWVWTGGTIVLGVCCLNMFTLPFAVLILKDWFSNEVKTYFGMAPTSAAIQAMPRPVLHMRTFCRVLTVLIGLFLLLLPLAFLMKHLQGARDEILDDPFGRVFLVSLEALAAVKFFLLLSVLRAGKSRWGWTGGVIFLGWSCLNIFLLPFAVLILKDWFSNEVKAYFGIAALTKMPPPLPRRTSPPPLPRSGPPPLPSWNEPRTM